jgi:hypothetical protein
VDEDEAGFCDVIKFSFKAPYHRGGFSSNRGKLHLRG